MPQLFSRSGGVALASVLAATCAACQSQSSLPLRPNTDRVDTLEIRGPLEIAPGGSARLSVIARLHDGAVEDVTSYVAWRVSPPTRLSIDSTGLATAHDVGDANVTAAYNSRAITRDIIVVPAGTYRVAGIVTESGAPLPDALVQVTAGTGTGMATTTFADGRYRLYGVAGQAELRVTKPGFQTRVININVASHVMQDVDVSPLSPRAEIAGSYRLDIETSPACRDQLPDEVGSRTYAAQVLQSGPILEVRLQGATFSRSRSGAGDRFRGRVEPEGITFVLTSHIYRYYGYDRYPDIVEKLQGAGFLVVEGSVRVPGSGTRLGGVLTGAVQYFEFDPAWGGKVTRECRGDHSFVLTRTAP